MVGWRSRQRAVVVVGGVVGVGRGAGRPGARGTRRFRGGWGGAPLFTGRARPPVTSPRTAGSRIPWRHLRPGPPRPATDERLPPFLKKKKKKTNLEPCCARFSAGSRRGADTGRRSSSGRHEPVALRSDRDERSGPHRLVAYGDIAVEREAEEGGGSRRAAWPVGPRTHRRLDRRGPHSGRPEGGVRRSAGRSSPTSTPRAEASPATTASSRTRTTRLPSPAIESRLRAGCRAKR
jgi:hypothetical protein